MNGRKARSWVGEHAVTSMFVLAMLVFVLLIALKGVLT